MSIPIQTKIKVLTKYVNDYTKQDGSIVHFYNLQFISDSGRVETLPCTEEVFNKVEPDNEYQLGGKCGGMGSQRWFSFDKVVK